MTRAVSRAEAKRKASLRRLKQRIANVFHGKEMTWYRSAACQIVDAWAAKERHRV